MKKWNNPEIAELNITETECLCWFGFTCDDHKKPTKPQYPTPTPTPTPDDDNTEFMS